MLNEKGLDIDTVNSNGDSILLLCAKDGIRQNIRNISKLLELGASKELKNKLNENFTNIAYLQAVKDIKFTEESKEIDLSGFKNNTNNNKKNLNNTILILSIIFLVFSILIRFFRKG